MKQKIIAIDLDKLINGFKTDKSLEKADLIISKIHQILMDQVKFETIYKAQTILDFVGLNETTSKKRILLAQKIIPALINSSDEIRLAYVELISSGTHSFTHLPRFVPAALLIGMLLTGDNLTKIYDKIRNSSLSSEKKSLFEKEYLQYSRNTNQLVSEDLKQLAISLRYKLENNLPIRICNIGVAPKIDGSESTLLMKELIDLLCPNAKNIEWYATDMVFPKYQFIESSNKVLPYDFFEHQKDGIHYIDVSKDYGYNFATNNLLLDKLDIAISCMVHYPNKGNKTPYQFNINNGDTIFCDIYQSYADTLNNISNSLSPNGIYLTTPVFLNPTTPLKFNDSYLIFSNDETNFLLLEKTLPYECISMCKKLGLYTIIHNEEYFKLDCKKEFLKKVIDICKAAYFLQYTTPSIHQGPNHMDHPLRELRNQATKEKKLCYISIADFFGFFLNKLPIASNIQELINAQINRLEASNADTILQEINSILQKEIRLLKNIN